MINIFQFEDDRAVQDMPTSRTSWVDDGLSLANVYYMGNTALNQLTLSTFQICMMSTSDCSKTCYTLDGTYWPWPGENIPYGVGATNLQSLDTDVKKQVACFTGQCTCTSNSQCTSYQNHCATPGLEPHTLHRMCYVHPSSSLATS